MEFMEQILKHFGIAFHSSSANTLRTHRRLSNGWRVFLNFFLTVVFAVVVYYAKFPPINLQAGAFYGYILAVLAFFALISYFTKQMAGQTQLVSKQVSRLPLYLALAVVVTIVGGGISSSQLLRASAYRDLITVEKGNFTDDITEISFDQIPMLDKGSAQRLGDRTLGDLSDMVSQFEVAYDYIQINYRDKPVRVTPLLYGDIIKWATNRSEGIPGYIMVDMVTQEATFVRLDARDKSIRYTTGEHFGRYLMRHVQFQYPTYLFDEPAFEVDDAGDPYWICPRLIKRVGLFGGTDCIGAVLVDASTGESVYYDLADVPQWVDHVFRADLVIQQYNYYGKYIRGFWNSLFGQRDVTQTTDGYNYLALDDDVYMYTGITSVGGDQSNIGFILANQRTKASTYYSIPGADEQSAMRSAEGVVQHLGYNSTFPLLLNIGGQPTYFMALKDSANLVKQYAMVNVQQYQIVSTGSTVELCEKEYRKLLETNKVSSSNGQPNDVVEQTVNGVLEDIRSAVVEGNTWYYLKLRDRDGYFRISAADSQEIVLLNVGESVRVVYTPPAASGGLIQAQSVTLQ